MSDLEIREWLRSFANEIFDNARRSNADFYNEKLEAFIKANGVTVEQMQEFAESGAGEELYMLTS